MDETWTCHVCGEERPDRYISVFSRTGLLGDIPYQENIRYCNDRPACVEGAQKVRWVQGAPRSPNDAG